MPAGDNSGILPGPGEGFPEVRHENGDDSIFFGVRPGSRRMGDYLRLRREWFPEEGRQ